MKRRRRHRGNNLISRHRGFSERELRRVRVRVRRDARRGVLREREEGADD